MGWSSVNPSITPRRRADEGNKRTTGFMGIFRDWFTALFGLHNLDADPFSKSWRSVSPLCDAMEAQ